MSYPSISRITPENYQDRLIAVTMPYHDFRTEKSILLQYAIGISRESGNISKILEQYVKEEGSLNREKLIDELGGIVAYICLLGSIFDIDLEDILLNNIRKLEARENNRILEGSGSDR